jgi:hypothetical protein
MRFCPKLCGQSVAVFRSYILTYILRMTPIAADETYVRLTALHPDRVSHVREGPQVSRQLQLRRSLIRRGN